MVSSGMEVTNADTDASMIRRQLFFFGSPLFSEPSLHPVHDRHSQSTPSIFFHFRPLPSIINIINNMTTKPNKLLKIVQRIHQFPTPFQSPALTYAFNSQIKYAGTTGIYIQEWTPDRAIVTLANKKRVQNHIGGIHATAMATLAESTTGMVFGLHVPDEKLPLLKSMNMKFITRAEGDLKAVATLPMELQEKIRTEERGSILVPVQVTDETGKEPIQCEMEWAWTTKKAKKKNADDINKPQEQQEPESPKSKL